MVLSRRDAASVVSCCVGGMQVSGSKPPSGVFYKMSHGGIRNSKFATLHTVRVTEKACARTEFRPGVRAIPG